MAQTNLNVNDSVFDQGGSVVVLPVNLQRLAYRRQHDAAGATPLLLTPNNILAMIADRKAFQAIKFRTTCSDPVPNW